MDLLRLLSPVNKIIIDKLKKQNVVIKELQEINFTKQVKEFRRRKLIPTSNNVDKVNGYYMPEDECILVRSNIDISKEFVLMHEVTHAIRDIKRANRLFLEPIIPLNFQKKIESYSKGSFIAKEFLKRRVHADLVAWREDAVADCISLFLCNQYGSTKRRDIKIGNNRVIFIPLFIKDFFTEKDRTNYLKVVKKECLYTLEYIFGHYLTPDSGLWDKKMVLGHFETFFDKEVDSCKKIISKMEQKQKKSV